MLFTKKKVLSEQKPETDNVMDGCECWLRHDSIQNWFSHDVACNNEAAKKNFWLVHQELTARVGGTSAVPLCL